MLLETLGKMTESMKMVCQLVGGGVFAANTGGFTSTSANGATAVTSPSISGADCAPCEGQTWVDPSGSYRVGLPVETVLEILSSPIGEVFLEDAENFLVRNVIAHMRGNVRACVNSLVRYCFVKSVQWSYMK